MKKRLILMQSAHSIAPFTVAPVAAAIAMLGLFLPWLVSAGTAVIVLVFTLVFFKNADSLETTSVQKLEDRDRSAENAKRPVADLVIWLMFVVYTILLSSIS